jgi:hypothetical protein
MTYDEGMGIIRPMEGRIIHLDIPHPVDLADYAVANQIQDEPAFAWWVPYVIRKRTATVSKLRSKYWQKTHKYGVCIPRSVNEA